MNLRERLASKELEKHDSRSARTTHAEGFGGRGSSPRRAAFAEGAPTTKPVALYAVDVSISVGYPDYSQRTAVEMTGLRSQIATSSSGPVSVPGNPSGPAPTRLGLEARLR